MKPQAKNEVQYRSTTINKLAIQGVRSFAQPDEQKGVKPQVVHFSKPLTLILGHNGAGKTTIIEALQYICTDKFPQNSDKGKLFGTDPSLNTHAETLGQVRLNFQGIKQHNFTFIKEFLVKNTKNGLSCTNQGGRIKGKVKEDQKVNEFELTKTCAQFEHVAPQLLGVSSSILQNIIFCPQESQFWMFEKNENLKEIFDSLFDTKKITQIIEKIEDTKKKLEKEKKEIEKHIANYEKEYNELIMETDEFDEKSQELKKKSEKIPKLDEELNQLIEQLKSEYQNVEQESTFLQDKQMQKYSDYNKMEQQIQQILENVDINYTNQYFEQGINEVEKQIDILNQQVREEEEKFKQCEDQIKIQLKNLDEKKEIQKNFQNDKNEQQLKNDLDEIQKKIKQNFDELEQQTSKNIVPREFIKILQNYITQVSNNFSNFQQNSINEKNKDQEKLKEILGKIRELQDQQSNLQIKKKDITQKIYDMNQQQMNDQWIIQQIDQNKLNLQQLTNDLSKNEKEIKNQEKKIVEQKKQQEKLTIQMSEISQKANSNKVKQDFYKCLENQKQIQEEIQQLKKNLQIQLTNQNVTNFQKLGYTMIKNEIEKQKLKINDAINRLQKQQPNFQGNINSEDSKIQYLETKINENKAKKEEIEFFLQDLIDQSDSSGFDEKLKQMKQKKEQANRNIIQYEFICQEYSEMQIKSIEDKSQCHVCKSALNEEISKKLKKKIEKKVQELQEQIEIDKKLRQNFKTQIKKLKENRNKFEDYQKCNEELKTFQEEIVKKQEEKYQWQQKFDQNQKEIGKLQADLELIQNKLYQTENLKEKEKNKEKIQNEILNIKSNNQQQFDFYQMESDYNQNPLLRSEVSNTNEEEQSTEQLVKELQENQSKTENLINQQKQLEFKNKQISQQVMNLENKQQKYKEQLQQQQQNIQLHVKNQNDLQTIENELLKLNGEIQNFKSEEQYLNEKISKFQKQYDIKKEEQQRNLQNLQIWQDEFQNKLEKYTLIQSSQKGKIKKEIGKKKEQLEIEISELEKLISDLEEEKQDLDITIVQSENELQNLKCIKKAILLNEEFQEIKAELQQIQDQISLNQQQIKQKQNLQLLINEKNLILTNLKTEITQQMKSGKESIQKSQYRLKNKEKQYYEYKTEISIKDIAIQELQQYSQKLTNSVIKCHKEKIQEINDKIKEIWSSVYTGGDICNIYIESNVEKDQKNSKNSKNYHYRIRQEIFNGNKKVKIDLKGRCSMGQKMLSSIVIRLALLEAFSSNCGVLALDEPTQNLDVQHIQSLCQSLKQLIKSREQSNLQLIIITHDKNLVSALKKQTTFYNQVQREEGGYSTIKKIPFDGSFKN